MSVEVTFVTQRTGFKTELAQLCKGSKILANISRSKVGETVATLQGPQERLSLFLATLKQRLIENGGIHCTHGPFIQPESDLTKITIMDTTPELKRDPSSGFFLEEAVLDDGISFGGSAATESVQKLIKAAFENFAGFGNSLARSRGYIPPEKHIDLSHNSIAHVLEVSTIRTMKQLMLAVNEKFNEAVPIESIYRFDNEKTTPTPVTHVSDLQAGMMYRCLNRNEEFPIAMPDPIPIAKVKQ